MKIVLKKILRQDLYDHFMTFRMAFVILVSPNLDKIYKNYAKELLQYFVLPSRKFYEPEISVYIVHCSLQLTESVLELDILDQGSAFILKTICITLSNWYPLREIL